jgi:hypothetical protein
MPETSTAEVVREKETAEPTTTVEAPAPPKARDPLSDAILSSYGDLVAARKKEREGLDAKAAGLAPRLDVATAALDARAQQIAQNPPPQPPVLTPPPSRNLSAFLSPREGESPEASVQKLFQAIGLFAGGVGGLARGDARGSLAAFPGALKGWNEGDIERGDRAFADWKARTETALQKWEIERSAYNDWLQAGNLSIEQMLAGLKLEAARHDNKQAALAFESGSIEKGLAFLQDQRKHEDALAATYAKLIESHNDKVANRELHANLARLTRESQERIAKMHADGMQALRGTIPMPGVWFDRETGERAYPTREQRLSLGEEGFAAKYHQSNQQGETRYEQIVIAKPMVKRLRDLSTRLLAKESPENLINAAELYAQGKMVNNPDLREFGALVEDVNVKMTSILGPGQFRVTLFNVLRGIGLHTKDTQGTAERVLNQWETNIDNDLRAITGQPMREHIAGPWQGWAFDPSGQRKWIRLSPGERIPPAWITLEESR